MKHIFTPNKFFVGTFIICMVAIVLTFVSGGWNYVEPFITSLYEIFCATGVLYYYCTQLSFKRTKLMHCVVACVMSLMLINLITGAFYTSICLADKELKDGEIANLLTLAYDEYMALYWFVGIAFSIGIGTFLLVYITTGEE